MAAALLASVLDSPRLAFVLLGVFQQYLGILWLLSYFCRQRSFLFRALMWVCEHFSSPSSSLMAFFYFALGVGMGTCLILHGLGLLDL